MADLSTASLTDHFLEKREALQRFLIARLGNEAEAEDILQEVFIKVQRIKSLKDIHNPVAFLYKMTSNLALDHIRSSQRDGVRNRAWLELNSQNVGRETVSDAADAEAALDAKQQLARLITSLDGLAPQCRRVFTLHKFQGLSHQTIADQLGIARSTVEKHMHAALKYLIKTLREETKP